MDDLSSLLQPLMQSPPGCHKIIWSRCPERYGLVAICQYCGQIFYDGSTTRTQYNTTYTCPANKSSSREKNNLE